jgi:hypothetical protein
LGRPSEIFSSAAGPLAGRFFAAADLDFVEALRAAGVAARFLPGAFLTACFADFFVVTFFFAIRVLLEGEPPDKPARPKASNRYILSRIRLKKPSKN